jgi:hypothetical protein
VPLQLTNLGRLAVAKISTTANSLSEVTEGANYCGRDTRLPARDRNGATSRPHWRNNAARFALQRCGALDFAPPQPERAASARPEPPRSPWGFFAAVVGSARDR